MVPVLALNLQLVAEVEARLRCPFDDPQRWLFAAQTSF